MKIICISGKAQHGKDTSAELLNHMLQNHGKRTVIMHYADLLKYICEKYFGWNGLKDAAGRTLLQKVGTDIVRKRAPDYWVNHLVKLIDVFYDVWDYVIIPDTRFPNEIDTWKESGYDVVHVRIDRPYFNSPLDAEQQQHPSETALDNVAPDWWITNTTLELLQEQLQELAASLE